MSLFLITSWWNISIRCLKRTLSVLQFPLLISPMVCSHRPRLREQSRAEQSEEWISIHHWNQWQSEHAVGEQIISTEEPESPSISYQTTYDRLPEWKPNRSTVPSRKNTSTPPWNNPSSTEQAAPKASKIIPSSTPRQFVRVKRGKKNGGWETDGSTTSVSKCDKFAVSTTNGKPEKYRRYYTGKTSQSLPQRL